jgi:integrase
VRVKLRGVVSIRRRLATGDIVIYHYAWRGGPRIAGEPGSPEFMASWQAALKTRRTPDPELFKSLIEAYKASAAFDKISERTRDDYRKQLARIEIAFGDLPLAALDDPRVTRQFLAWRDSMRTSPRQADYGWTVLMRVISWGRDNGLTSYRPPDRVERLYTGDRAEMVWGEEHVAAFWPAAPAPVQWALMLAIETGQRQGDLLRLPWSAYDGTFITLRQSKTGRPVAIPVTRRLRAVLETIPRISPVILTSDAKRPWRPNAFRQAWQRATKRAGIVGLTFHDLRGTAVTRLSEAGCTPQEIATITGHSLRDVGAILDRYSARTTKLAVAAIAKLERSRKVEDGQ